MRGLESRVIGPFVAGLSDEECREQLRLAYGMMEVCVDVLHGRRRKPVEMMDNGLSTDLELYYACLAAAERLEGDGGEG